MKVAAITIQRFYRRHLAKMNSLIDTIPELQIQTELLLKDLTDFINRFEEFARVYKPAGKKILRAWRNYKLRKCIAALNFLYRSMQPLRIKKWTT